MESNWFSCAEVLEESLNTTFPERVWVPISDNRLAMVGSIQDGVQYRLEMQPLALRGVPLNVVNLGFSVAVETTPDINVESHWSASGFNRVQPGSQFRLFGAIGNAFVERLDNFAVDVALMIAKDRQDSRLRVYQGIAARLIGGTQLNHLTTAAYEDSIGVVVLTADRLSPDSIVDLIKGATNSGNVRIL